MSQLRQHYTALSERGWTVIGITTQAAAAVGEYTRAQKIPFPILIDEDRTVTKAYGVHTVFHLDGFRVPTVNMPHNSTFLIDNAGRIRFVHVGMRSTDIPDESALQAALTRMEGA